MTGDVTAVYLPGDEPVELPPFPIQTLPAAVASLVSESAEAAGTSTGLVALPALVTLAAAIGASRWLEIKGTWREYPVLWGAVVAPPSTGKTPAMRPILSPIRAWQRDRFAEYRKELAAFEHALAHSKNGDRPTRPVARRLIVDDFTVEQLCAINEENPRGLVMVRDELSAWVRSMNQYKAKGRGADRSHALSLWSSTPITVDRRSNPEPIYIECPILSLIGGIQPGLLQELRGDESADGFLERFLFVMDPDAPSPDWSDREVSDYVRGAWNVLVGRLLALEDEPLRFSSSGRAAWVEGYNRHISSFRDAPDDLRAVFGKYQAYAARLMVVLHMAWRIAGDIDETDVGESTVARGWELVEYFKAQAAAAFGRSIASDVDQRVEALVSFLRRNNGVATRRDIVRHKVGRAMTNAEADEIIGRFVERDLGIRVAENVRGGQRVSLTLGPR